MMHDLHFVNVHFVYIHIHVYVVQTQLFLLKIYYFIENYCERVGVCLGGGG